MVTIRWTSAPVSGSSGAYPNTLHDLVLPRPSGTIGPDPQSGETVLSATAPSRSSGSFNVTYFDNTGRHVVRSPSFYWVH